MSMRAFLTKRSVEALIFSILGALVVFCLPASARGNRDGTPGDFDYYLLSLSWSPSFCEGRSEGGSGGGDNGADQQCSGGRPYAFVLHGLWPQYQRDWPESCHTPERPWVSDDIISRMLDIMPSKQLIIHEYRKHGTCSGLGPREYFETGRRAYESIKIPERFSDLKEQLSVTTDEVVQAFVKANPQLQADMVSVSCSRNRLQEVRICMSKDLKPQACGQNEKSSRQCDGRALTMPPLRAGGGGEPRRGRDQGI